MAQQLPNNSTADASPEKKALIEALAAVAGSLFLSYAFSNVTLLGPLFALASFVAIFKCISAAWSFLKSANVPWLADWGYQLGGPANFVVIAPIPPSPDSFDAASITMMETPVPVVRGEWLSIMSDHETLSRFAATLDSHRLAVDRVAQKAVDKFQADRRTLLQHQKGILQRAYYARARISRFRQLPGLKLASNGLPQLQRLKLPHIPNYLTPDQYARKYSVQPSHAISAVSRTLMTQGVNQGNLIAAGVALAVGAVVAKQRVSKALRALEDARGQVASLCVEAKSTVTLLRRAHEEIVVASVRIKEVAIEIETLTKIADGIPADVTQLEELPPDQQQDVKTLWYWALCADQASRDAVV